MPFAPGMRRKLEEVEIDALAPVQGGHCSVKVYEAYNPGWLAWLGGARATPRMVGITGDCYEENSHGHDRRAGGVMKHGAVVLSEDARPQYRAARKELIGR